MVEKGAQDKYEPMISISTGSQEAFLWWETEIKCWPPGLVNDETLKNKHWLKGPKAVPKEKNLHQNMIQNLIFGIFSETFLDTQKTAFFKHFESKHLYVSVYLRSSKILSGAGGMTGEGGGGGGG